MRDGGVDERGVAGFHEAASEFSLLNQPLEVTSTLFSSITRTCSPPPDASKLLLRAKSGANNPGCVITMRMTQPDYQAMLDVALEEARQGLAEGGVPIGAALFGRDGTLLGRGHNRRVQDGDPSAHGETDAFRNAGRQRSYKDTVMVTTLAPCWYCSGLVKQFGIPTLVVGESETFQGGSSGSGKTVLKSSICGRRRVKSCWAGLSRRSRRSGMRTSARSRSNAEGCLQL